MSKKFKEFYNEKPFSYEEDKEVLKALKRQVTSYLRESTQERFHGIFNKLYILRNSIERDEFYDIILSEMNSEQKEEFLRFVLSEGFGLKNDEEELIKEDVWEHQLNRVLELYNR